MNFDLPSLASEAALSRFAVSFPRCLVLCGIRADPGGMCCYIIYRCIS